MADKSWKAFERAVAKAFGCPRNSLSGGNSKATRSDTLHPQLFVECKHAKRLSVWSLFQKTKELAMKEGKTPVLTLKQKHGEGFLVVCDSRDLKEVAHEKVSEDPVRVPEERKG